ncbi:nitroreductase family protein [Alphaproteobacteria bacterium]|nr:nitroreductase family protein [Alphaproteobacteria bacterium]
MMFKNENLEFNRIPIKDIIIKSKKFYEIISKRRSVRDFDSKKIDLKIIKNAILSAGSAPNGANLQPWHFVIIKNKKIKKKIKIAAEKEEKEFYEKKAPKEWLKALEPLGTDENKEFIENAPVLIAIFEKKYSYQKKKKIKNYYVRESVGIATGILISCLHMSGLCMLTHTPSPMNFLNTILGRPSNEKPFVLLIIGYPNKDCKIPTFAKNKKKLKEISTIF